MFRSISLYIYLSIYLSSCRYKPIHIYICIYICTHVSVYLYECIYTSVFHICIYIYIYMNLHTYINIYIDSMICIYRCNGLSPEPSASDFVRTYTAFEAQASSLEAKLAKDTGIGRKTPLKGSFKWDVGPHKAHIRL